MNISKKLKLAFASAIALPLIIIAVLVITQTRQQALDSFAELSEREARQVDNGISMFFAEIEKNVDYLASHAAILDAKQGVKTHMQSPSAEKLDHLSGSSTEQNAFSLFDHFGATHPGLAYIYMGNEQGGYIQWPEGEVTANYDPRVRPWYETGKAADGKTVRTNAYYWAADDMVIVSTVKAIKQAGEFVGVQGMDVSLQGLTDIIANIKLGETGYLMLIEDSGNVLVDVKNADYRFKQLAEVNNGKYKQLAENNQGQFEIDINGKDYLANIYTSQKLGWKFIGLVEKSEVMSAANAMTITILVISAILIAVFILVASYISKLISAPIVEVSDGLTEISQGGGDLTKRLVIKTRDETAKLANSFNLFLNLISDLVTQINDCAQNVSDTSAQTSSQAAQLSGSTSQQQQALEMAATAINEMAATANEVSASCANAAELASQTQQASELGQSVITETVDSVVSLSEVITKATQDINQLDAESENIMSILSVIRGIAEQTNLLALNAAIEAARAGEQGRGFAVVADEVRTLANRTHDSTEEIEKMIGSLQADATHAVSALEDGKNKAKESVEITQQVNEQVREITQIVTALTDINQRIVADTKDQDVLLEQATQSLNQIVTLADNTANSTHQSSEVTAEIEQQMSSLKQAVDKFKV